ncbi:MAG: ABC transporter ATP-binding protein [Promethearchaeota archaeon]
MKLVRIRLENVSFKKDNVQILSNINLTIEDQEYLIIVGPTGAGKTSLIGLISGLYKPTSGKIFFDNEDITNLPPNERNCGVMFESYALFPHLNVLDNVSYARHMQTNDHNETYSIAEELLHLVRLSGREEALPSECSGGMQQRVALARSIMALSKGGVIILDEPFKALDAGLRLNLRREVKKIAKSKHLNLTTIHITNDMQEAMMGDKIVVLDEGKIRQIGTPEDIMYSPIDLFIANFFSSELNHFSGKILRIEDIPIPGFKKKTLQKVIIQSEEGYILFAKTEKKFNVGDEVTFIIRSQYFKARHKKRVDKTNSIFGTIKRVKFMGAWLRLEIEAPYNIENLQILKEKNDGNSTPLKETTNDSNPEKILKIEVPTTHITKHDFIVGQTVTVFYHSQYAIVFPKINDIDDILKIH